MRIGRLRHRVTIEEVVRRDDGQGGFTETWVTKAEVWGGVEPIRGMERFEAQKVNANISHKVIIRYLFGLTEAMRVNFKDRYLTIEAIINPNEKNESMELLCSEET